MFSIKYAIGISLILCSYFDFVNYKTYTVLDKAKEDYSLSKIIQETHLQKSILAGKEIYSDFCIQCHLSDGKGDAKNFPPLDGSNWLKDKTSETIHAIKFGQSGEIIVNQKKFNNTMPEMGLSNQEVADVMNYIRNSWSNKNPKIITLKQVEAIKK